MCCVWILAVPSLSITGEPRSVPFTRNCTVPPFGVPTPGLLALTVAVSVTVWPYVGEVVEAPKTIVVASGRIVTGVV